MEFCTEFPLCSCPTPPIPSNPHISCTLLRFTSPSYPRSLHFSVHNVPPTSHRHLTDISPTSHRHPHNVPMPLPRRPADPLSRPRSGPKSRFPSSPSSPTSDALIPHSNPSLLFVPLIHTLHPAPISVPHIPGTPSCCNPSAVSDETSHGYHT